MNILVIEDEERIAYFISRGLEEEGYTVDTAGTAAIGTQKIAQKRYDALILDIMLPDHDGISLCAELRKAGYTLPVLMLTARGSVADKVSGLDSGADDYLTKPFAFEEFLARLRALLRKASGNRSSELTVANLKLDTAQQRVYRGEREIELSRREYALLEYMMRNLGTIVTRAMIADHVWHMQTGNYTNLIDVFINHLRKKIDDGESVKLIRTVRGRGYLIDPERLISSELEGSDEKA